MTDTSSPASQHLTGYPTVKATVNAMQPRAKTVAVISVTLAFLAALAGCGGGSSSLQDIAQAAHAKPVSTARGLVDATTSQTSACADTEQLNANQHAAEKGRFICVLWPGDRIVYGDSPSDFTP